MRIFQIAHLHSTYANLLIQRNLGKRHTYAECVQSYLDDGYWGGHTLTPALERLGHETFLCVSDSYSQCVWSREHGLKWENAHCTCLDQIAFFKPDVLYIGSVLDFYDYFLDALPWRPKVIVGWHATNSWTHMDMHHFDLVLSSHGACLDFARKRGASHTAYSYPGIGIADTKDALAQEQKADICFAGGYWSASHIRRNRLLIDLAKRADALGLTCAYNIGLYEDSPPCPSVVQRHNGGPVWGEAMLDVFASSRITLNAYCALDNKPQNLSPNLRQLEAMGVGSLLLTEQSPNLEAFFTENADLITFTNVNELIDKARYYLANEDKRRAIAAHGQHTCRTRYSMDVRARAFMDKIHHILAVHPPLPTLVRAIHALAAACETTPDAVRSADATSLIQSALNQIPALFEENTPEGHTLLRALETLPLDAPPQKNMNYCSALALSHSNDTATAKKLLHQELDAWPENDAARNALSTLYVRDKNENYLH